MDLLKNLDKLHTTKLWIQRIKRNISLETDDVIFWCKNKISSPQAQTSKQGKNFYVQIEDYIFTINSHSFTVITVHKNN